MVAALCVSGGGAQLDSTRLTVTAENGVTELPFKLINNHVILPVSVNGSPTFNVLLDTGMPGPGLALYGGPRAEALDLGFDPAIQVQIRGAGGQGERLVARVAMEESLALAGVAIDKARVLLLPALPEFGGYHDGIIGYSLFERFVVELDYDERRVRLHDPRSYETPHDAHVLPLTLRGKVPHVTLWVTPRGRKAFEARVVVDLGAAHAISLNTDSADDVVIPEEALTTTLGHGLSGPVKGEVGRIAALELGGARLRNVLASFPVSGHQNPRGDTSLTGNLGNEVLRRFNTTFDYAGGRLILQPNESFGQPFTFDRSGIVLGLGSELKVVDIIVGSPAEVSGIQIEDVVTHVDGEAVAGKDLGDVREVLKATGKVQLSLRRGKKTFQKTLTLRRLI